MILENNEFDFFVGSKIGSFKHIKFFTDPAKNTKKCIQNLTDIKCLQKDDTITCLSWNSTEQTEILIGRKNQQVQIYDTVQGDIMKSFVADNGKGEVVGLHKLKRSVVTALASGVVKVWAKKEAKQITLDTGGALDVMRGLQEDQAVIATGGEENDLKVWRLGESAPIFAAKNLANDFLQLRQPVWVSDLCFLPDNDGKILATCSRHGFVRLYDTRAQRRPVCNVECKNMAATCISNGFLQKQVLVGFGRGQLHQVDFRSAGRLDKGYKGSVGAITSVSAVTGSRYIVSTSLDRFLKVHDAHSKEIVFKQYLTSKLSSVLVQTACRTALKGGEQLEVKDEDATEEVSVELEQAASGDELDDLFENMETISEKPTKKRSIEVTQKPSKKAKTSKKNKKQAKEVTQSVAEVIQSEGEVAEDDTNEGKSDKANNIEKQKKHAKEVTLTEGEGIQSEEEDEKEDGIVKLLKSTEKKKRKLDKIKKLKKSKSLFHNA